MKFLAPALLLVLCGCMSTANIIWFHECEGGQRVFGGVRAGIDQIHQALAPEPPKGEPDFRPSLVLPILDMPLSVAGDIATLPITVPVSMARKLVPHKTWAEDIPLKQEWHFPSSTPPESVWVKHPELKER